LIAGVVAVFGEECDDAFWRLPGRLGFGLVLDPEVVVEDELELLELELEVELVLEDVVVEEDVVERVGLGTDTVGVVDEDDGVQDSLSEVITPWTGRFNEETGVPAGTFT
jgi:hypothetical protein